MLFRSNISWMNFVLKKIPAMKAKRDKLAQISDLFRNELVSCGFFTKGSSHIVPVITGDDEKTVLISEKMKTAGFYVPAVRPPTVPAGTSRLRFSLTADFLKDDVESIILNLKR